MLTRRFFILFWNSSRFTRVPQNRTYRDNCSRFKKRLTAHFLKHVRFSVHIWNSKHDKRKKMHTVCTYMLTSEKHTIFGQAFSNVSCTEVDIRKWVRDWQLRSSCNSTSSRSAGAKLSSNHAQLCIHNKIYTTSLLWHVYLTEQVA